jgi:hypothetical protein
LKAIQNVQQILIVLGDLDRMLQCIFAKFHIPSTCAHHHGLSSLFAQDELFWTLAVWGSVAQKACVLLNCRICLLIVFLLNELWTFW